MHFKNILILFIQISGLIFFYFWLPKGGDNDKKRVIL